MIKIIMNNETIEIPYVSTNDIITSWFFRTRNHDYGMMLVNFRNRICGLTDTDAGNYEVRTIRKDYILKNKIQIVFFTAHFYQNLPTKSIEIIS